jgi:putative sigma-54 modulation protein
MNIDFTGRHVELDDRIRSHAEERLGKATKHLAEPVEVRVRLENEKFRKIAEIEVRHRRGALRSREESNDLIDAITLAADHLERQARRSRGRAIDRRRRAGRRNGESTREWPVEVLESGSVGRGATPRVIRETRLEIKPMTLDEAALQLETSKNEFVVFVDADSERVNVLYRRRDNHYGLIVPEP